MDEDAEGRAAWQRFLEPPVGWKRRHDRARVGRAVLNDAWMRGDLAAVMELAESLRDELGEEPDMSGGEDGRRR